MNPAFFQRIENILHTERIDVYRRDGADYAITLSRYLLNMALSESLYPALQFAEIALRNAIHQTLTTRCGTDAWYDSPLARLSTWQQDNVTEAKDALRKRRKALTPGRIVAELTFGFWTAFFNNWHARTGIGSYLAKNAFPHAPAAEQYQSKLDRRWLEIRDLRNRVFHHERIIHWRDLDVRHDQILQVITWISPELHEMASVLDRFTAIRQAGLAPWLNKLHRYWPNPARLPTTADAKPAIAMIPEAFNATNGAETPFGRRWGGDVFHLAPDHLAALQAGQTLALDVQNEYVTFLQCAESAKLEPAIKAKLRGLDYGG